MKYEEITYRSLYYFGAEQGYTSHILHFKNLFKLMDVNGFLEFGCGYSTKIFIENSKRVYTVEVLSSGSDDEWINKCRLLYKNCHNWKGLTYKSDAVDKAAGDANAMIDFDLGGEYFDQLNKFCEEIIKESAAEGHPIDVCFVDSTPRIRGDLFEIALRNKIPVVVAHDMADPSGTDRDRNDTKLNQIGWRWDKIQSHREYQKIFLTYGTTAMWVRRDLKKIIDFFETNKDHFYSEYKELL